MFVRKAKSDRWFLLGVAAFAAIELVALCGFFYSTGERNALLNRAAKQRAPSQEIVAQATADWAWWSAFAALLQLGGIAAVLVTIRQTRDANHIAREIGQAQTRAYVSITRAECHLLDDRVEFRYSLKNVGNSPARGVLLHIRAAVVMGPEILSIDPPRLITSGDEELFGWQISAGEEIDRTHIPSREISTAALSKQASPLWSINIIASLSYIDVFGERISETQNMTVLAGAGLNPTPIVPVPFHAMSFEVQGAPSFDGRKVRAK